MVSIGGTVRSVVKVITGFIFIGIQAALVVCLAVFAVAYIVNPVYLHSYIGVVRGWDSFVAVASHVKKLAMYVSNKEEL